MWDLENYKYKHEQSEPSYVLLYHIHQQTYLTDNYNRAVALNLEDYEVTTNEEIYRDFGIQSVVVSLKDEHVVFIGNTDMLYRCYDLIENNFKYCNHYKFRIVSFGSYADLNIIFKYTQLLSPYLLFEPDILLKYMDENKIYKSIDDIDDITELHDMIYSLNMNYVGINFVGLRICLDYKSLRNIYLVCDYLEELIKFFNSMTLTLYLSNERKDREKLYILYMIDNCCKQNNISLNMEYI